MSADERPVVERFARLRTVEARWRLFAVVGIVLVVVGVLAVLFPVAVGASVRLVVGGALLVSGVPMLAHALRSETNLRQFAWELVLGLLYVGVGLVLVLNLDAGLVGLAPLLALFLAVAGVLQAALGVRLRPVRYWWLLVAAGAVSVVLGALLWTGWPSTEPWALGTLVGLGLATNGLAIVALSVAVGRPVGAGAAEAATDAGES